MAGNPFPSSDPREAIRQEWIAAAPFWRKWYAQLCDQSRRATELVVNGAALATGMHVLNLASGTGEPSLSLAVAVGPQGRVVATDLVREMIFGQHGVSRASRKCRVIKNCWTAMVLKVSSSSDLSSIR